MKDKETLILGLGNSLRGDDGIGLYVATALKETFEDQAAVGCTEEMGLALLDFLFGYDKAIIIDSLCTQNKNIGRVHRLSLADFPSHSQRSNHFMGLPEVAALANRLHIPFPHSVHILGIEVADPYQINTALSPSLQRRVPAILSAVENEIQLVLCSETSR